jgi:hypothetical protein
MTTFAFSFLHSCSKWAINHSISIANRFEICNSNRLLQWPLLFTMTRWSYQAPVNYILGFLVCDIEKHGMHGLGDKSTQYTEYLRSWWIHCNNSLNLLECIHCTCNNITVWVQNINIQFQCCGTSHHKQWIWLIKASILSLSIKQLRNNLLSVCMHSTYCHLRIQGVLVHISICL